MSEGSRTGPVSNQRTEHADPLRVLQNQFGLSSFRGSQEAIMRHIMAGGDALVVMPTGAGKSLCYQVPAVCLGGVTLVISPLIALMDQQCAYLQSKGIASVAIHAALTSTESAAAMRDLVNGSWQVIFVAPERVCTAAFQDALRQTSMSLIVVDEAHCISAWGHDFRPEYRDLHTVFRKFPQVPRLALTATAPPHVRKDILETLGMVGAQVFQESVDRPNISLSVFPKFKAKDHIKRFIQSRDANGAGLVYCRTRQSVETITQYLKQNGIAAQAYHAGLSIAERQRVHTAFKSEHCPVVVATVAFGMGIDRGDVRYVVHNDPPQSLGAYSQEIGRAGRDGSPAEAIMFMGLSDIQRIMSVLVAEKSQAEKSQAEKAHVKGTQAVAQFCDVIRFAESQQCRRQFLKVYFGETPGQPCGTCDRCTAPVQWTDAIQQARMIISAIYRCGYTATADHVIHVLTGQRTQRVLRHHHQELSVFGIGADWPEGAWRALLRRLIGDHVVSIQSDETIYLIATEKARPLLTTDVPYLVPNYD